MMLSQDRPLPLSIQLSAEKNAATDIFYTKALF